MKRILAACGNDCSACPRYITPPYEKTEEELRHTSELWLRIGYRDHIVSNAEISCSGCRPENWCRYQVVKCCVDKGIKTCAECADYPCANMKECFETTKSFEPTCRQVCTEEEYEQLKKAFFEKEKNLGEMAEPGAKCNILFPSISPLFSSNHATNILCLGSELHTGQTTS